MTSYTFVDDWFTDHIPHWTHHLAEFAMRADVWGLEIGSWEGRSAVWLLEHVLQAPGCVLMCVDPWNEDEACEQEINFDRNVEAALLRSAAHLQKLKGRSQDVLRGLPVQTYSIIYIDGSHRADDVLHDVVVSWELLTPGGVLICDDYPWTPAGKPEQMEKGPGIALDAFLSCYEGRYELLHKEWQVLVRKIY
jgi:predicted O-methyltransferase YrrM